MPPLEMNERKKEIDERSEETGKAVNDARVDHNQHHTTKEKDVTPLRIDGGYLILGILSKPIQK